MPRFSKLLVLLLVALSLQACIIIPIRLPMAPEVRQVVYRQGSGLFAKKIAILDISGVIDSGGAGDGFFSQDSSVVDLSRKLHAVSQDKSIRAIILRVDSPGGGVTASDIMYHDLLEFRKQTGVPVYVSMQTVAASGGYYISMAADKVYATPTSITGSIGVIGLFPDATGLMKLVGLRINAVKSGAMKDAGALYREMSPEDHALYQAMIDDYYGKFVDVVAANRTALDRDTVTRLADGRAYTASQALEAGLIDGVAYLDQVIEVASNEQRLAHPTVVILSRSGAATTDTIYAATHDPSKTPAAQAPQINLFNVGMPNPVMDKLHEPFNFLWVP